LPSIASHLLPLLLRALRANRTFVDPEAARARVEERRATPLTATVPAKFDGRFSVALDSSRGWPVYRIAPLGGDAHGAVVYVHGGAWINEITSYHWRLIGDIVDGARATVIVPLYPLVPHGTAKEVVDAVASIVEKARDEFGAVAIAGDSAGGQIALSTVQVLRDRGGAALPATILIAPGLDLSISNPNIPAVQLTDPWLATKGMRILIDEWRGELAVVDPRVSPLFGDFAGLGPLTI
jgi:acetyl esterase/lipase